MLEQLKRYLARLSEGRRSKWVYAGIFAIWVVYLFLNLNTPIGDSARLDLSEQEIFFLRLTIIIPYLLIWLAAAYSFIRVINYSTAIKDSKEANGFYLLSLGILALLASLILSTISSTIDGFVDSESVIHKDLVILSNYLRVFPYLIAFWFFLAASRILLRRLKLVISKTNFIFFGVLLAASVYLWLDLIFTNPTRSVGTADSPATYYLRDSMIVLTIVIPSIVAWVLGIWAVLSFTRYRNKVKGIIYRHAFSSLAVGIWAVIVTSILLQGLLSLGSERLLDLGLGPLLGLIYLFVVIQGVGFLFIALGAKRLTLIETV